MSNCFGMFCFNVGSDLQDTCFTSSKFTSFKKISDYYQLKEVVGVGSSSVCYKCFPNNAKNTSNDSTEALACKIIDKRRLAVDPSVRLQILELIRNEIHILKSINHPNVIRLEAVYEDDRNIFLIMEFVRGGELFDFIAERGRLSEKEAAHIVHGIASGLSHLHSKGIMHRDLKPENLLLTSKSENLLTSVVKIVDFGFSRTLSHKTNKSTSYLGTPGYLAPELRQRHEYSNLVDIWSLGVITYLLLCGRLPFAPEMDPLPSHGVPISRFLLRFPEIYWKEVGSAAKDLIWRMLQVDPALRCTAEEILSHPWVHSDPATDTSLWTPYILQKYGNPYKFQSFFIEPHTTSRLNLTFDQYSRSFATTSSISECESVVLPQPSRPKKKIPLTVHSISNKHYGARCN